MYQQIISISQRTQMRPPTYTKLCAYAETLGGRGLDSDYNSGRLSLSLIVLSPYGP